LLTRTAKIDYPIKTSFEMNQPRLLLISVDVKDCSTPVTFDSYHSYASKCDVCNKECNTNDSLVKHMRSNHIRTQISKESLSTSRSSSSTLYRENASKLRTILESIDDDDGDGDDALWYSVYGDEENLKQKHVICYDGIGEDQLMASCLFPYSNYHPTLYDLITNEIRTYWDGAFLSNTPLRELLQRHREFWENYFRENNIKYDDLGLTEVDDGGKKNNEDLRPRVPDLEVFIVNLYPALEPLDELIPSDKDKIEDRLNDIRFHDRTNMMRKWQT
jgi:NTE family protein